MLNSLEEFETPISVHDDAAPLPVQNEKGQGHLKDANRTIIRQQLAVIEEQRQKVLFQMLGITLHELNQPLTSLLGNIELMALNQDRPDRLKENIRRVEEAGKRFSGIIRKIQNIRQGRALSEPQELNLMKSGRELRLLVLSAERKVSDTIATVMDRFDDVTLVFEESVRTDTQLADHGHIDMVLMDAAYAVQNELIIEQIKEQNLAIPILAVIDSDVENRAFELIRRGVDDYCGLEELTHRTALQALKNLKEKADVGHLLNVALQDLANMSIQDEHTGLFQRKYFRDALEREMIKVKRKDIICAVCKLDMGDYMAVADEGHNGDKTHMAKRISDVICQTLGENCLVCRYSSESFAFILADTTLNGALETCDSLRKRIESHLLQNVGTDDHAMIYMGVAQLCPDTVCPVNELLAKIDKATRHARETGHSPVSFFE